MTSETEAPIRFGDIVLVRFPFTNQTGFKQRPAVVVSNAKYNQIRPDVVMMGITSKMLSTATLGNVEIAEWQRAGLMKPSAIKPVLATVEKALIVRRLGQFQDTDITNLRVALAAIFD